MPNEQNLRPSEYKLSQDEAKRGGIASGKARREKKTLAQRVKMFGEMMVDGKTATTMTQMGIQPEDQDRFTQAAISLFQKAMKGDVAAFNAIRDIIGEKPVDETKVTGSVQTDISIELIDSGSKPVEDEGAIDLRRQQEEQLP